MADDKTIDSMLNGVFSGGTEEVDDTYTNENNDLFDMLGMSDEEKQKAATKLSEDEVKYNKSMSSANTNEMSMKEKAEQEALAFMKQAKEQNVDIAKDTSETEENRLDSILDSILDNDTSSASNTSEQSTSTVADSLDNSINPAISDNLESASSNEAIISDIPNTTNQPAQDALEQMNTIIDNAAAKSDVDFSTKDNTAEESTNEDFQMLNNLMQQSQQEDTETVSDFSDIPISDEILGDIDINEDLTNVVLSDAQLNDLVSETELSKKELKRKRKKEEKERKKERKKAEKAAQKEKRTKQKRGSAKDVIDSVDDVANTINTINNTSNVGNDIINTISQVAAQGVEQAAQNVANDIDLSSILDSEEYNLVDSDGVDVPNLQTDLPVDEKPKESFWKRLSLLLFGAEEDDEPTPEELAAMEAKKEKKAQKKEENAQKKQEKKEAKELKKTKSREMAVVKKAAAKDKRDKIRQQEDEEDAKEKKITPKAVVSIVLILSILGSLVVFGTNQFNYHMVITRATNYFEMQKYKMAYDQIVGVDVKDRDQKIKDKIYCVMYVQQQLDSYNNFTKLEMYENALDSLLKGVKKYNSHIAQAKKLGISSDMDGLQKEILKILKEEYGLDNKTVDEWINLDQTEYTKTIQDYVAGITITKSSNPEANVNSKQ